MGLKLVKGAQGAAMDTAHSMASAFYLVFAHNTNHCGFNMRGTCMKSCHILRYSTNSLKCANVAIRHVLKPRRWVCIKCISLLNPGDYVSDTDFHVIRHSNLYNNLSATDAIITVRFLYFPITFFTWCSAVGIIVVYWITTAACEILLTETWWCMSAS